MTQRFSTTSFILGVLFGLLFAGAWFLGGEATPDASSDTLTVSNDSRREESGALSVLNQTAGEEVFVESVTVPPPGVWVAVRETNENTLGNVLGATRINGPQSGIVIALLRATEPQRSYAIELYRDDNEGGGFNPLGNSVYIDFDSGQPVIVYFNTTE